MELTLENGDCLELMKKLPDKSVDLFICDLPYAETNCKWDIAIDMDVFWAEFKRLRKSPKTACIHFCSTKFGYQLIKSWEKGFKMDMVWKKRNKTGGLQSRHRPMRNHEMVYFFYDQAPKYNRDKYHKRIQAKLPMIKDDKQIMGKGYEKGEEPNFNCSKYFEPPNPLSVFEADPASVVEEKPKKKRDEAYSTRAKEGKDIFGNNDIRDKPHNYDPPNPASVVEEYIEPAEDEPWSMFESKKVFIGKRNHQTEKPLDILEFFLKYWTNDNDTILDPTMGSGSTGVACKNIGNRKFIGYEMNETIFKVAQKRCGVDSL
tara:strand:+ start:1664 stop:2614 length:951 start_codon:yes stop_codon:yes gene_type:complete